MKQRENVVGLVEKIRRDVKGPVGTYIASSAVIATELSTAEDLTGGSVEMLEALGGMPEQMLGDLGGAWAIIRAAAFVAQDLTIAFTAIEVERTTGEDAVAYVERTLDAMEEGDEPEEPAQDPEDPKEWTDGD